MRRRMEAAQGNPQLQSGISRTKERTKLVMANPKKKQEEEKEEGQQGKKKKKAKNEEAKEEEERTR